MSASEMARARARGTTLADEGLTTGDIVAGARSGRDIGPSPRSVLQALDGLSLDEKLAPRDVRRWCAGT